MFSFILTIIFALIVVGMIYGAKFQVEHYYKMKEEFKLKGEDYCVKELLIDPYGDRKDALKEALRELRREAEIKENWGETYE